MRAQYEQLYRVADGPSFEAYLQVLESRLTRFELPLGASVDQLPNGQIVLQVRAAAARVCAHELQSGPLRIAVPYQMLLAVHTLKISSAARSHPTAQ